MKLARRILGGVTAALCACSGSSQPSASGTIGMAADVSALRNDGSLAHVTATVLDAQGQPASGSVAFTASAGNLNGSGTTALSVALNAAGQATVTYACDVSIDPARCGPGSVAVNATWSGVTNGMRLTLQGLSSSTDAGSPDAGSSGGTDAGTGGSGSAGPAASITVVSATPGVLGLKGSGIQETGLTTFLVTDSSGRAVSGATVSFGQNQPALVTLAQTSAVTSASGTVSVGYDAGPLVGITAITATVAATGAAGSQPIAVRGARPSASGFYFRCSKTNLPVYTTTLEYETTTCTVRLSDRYGNRVGIATPVNFAAEAGAISANAVTKPFDFATPADPDEGSVTVTFSSDMARGFGPVETTPIAGEPSVGNANPRDQLVTIIAMVRGEEAFVDANLDGQYNAGELFVDQGDPFIDSNDNNAYTGDEATEPRFCGGTDCSTYHGPNGLWDSDRTIWVPTWIAFTDAPKVTVDPWIASSCVDYVDNNVPNPSSASTGVSFRDGSLNAPAAGTTYDASFVGAPSGLTLNTLFGFDELENVGSSDPFWQRVSEANVNQPCTVATTTNGACVMQTRFGPFDDGHRLVLRVDDTNKTPAAAAPGHVCGGTPTAGTNLGSFTVQINAKGPHKDASAYTNGTYAF